MKKKTNRFLRVITWLMIVGILLVGSGCSSIVSVGDEGTKEKSQSEPTAETESATTDEQNQAETPEQSSEPKPQGKTSNDLIVKSDGKLKIAYLLDALANDSSQRHWQQVQNECETRGWELISDTNVSGNYDADPTRKAFQNMMSQQPDAIVISYLDIPPIADLCLEANKKGIGVYCVGTDISDGIMMNVNSNNSVIGAKVMAYVMNRLNGEANVIGFQTLWMTRGIRRDEVAIAMANSKTYSILI